MIHSRCRHTGSKAMPHICSHECDQMKMTIDRSMLILKINNQISIRRMTSVAIENLRLQLQLDLALSARSVEPRSVNLICCV